MTDQRKDEMPDALEIFANAEALKQFQEGK